MTRLFLPLLLIGAACLTGSAGGAEATAQNKSENHEMTSAPEMPTGVFAEFVSPADSLPRLRYLADGKTTLNDRCPVRKVRLNPKMGASYVNGRPVGFC